MSESPLRQRLDRGPCPPLSEVISQRVRSYRTGRGWSQQRLADEMDELGYPIDRVTLSKLEAGKTRTDNVPLREILVLAAALGVPPVLLFLPIGEGSDVHVTPEVRMDAELALAWVSGKEPFCVRGEDGSSRVRNVPVWKEATRPLYYLDEHQRLIENVHSTELQLHTSQPAPTAQPRFDAALAQLYQLRRSMRELGIEPGWISDEWRGRAELLQLGDDPPMDGTRANDERQHLASAVREGPQDRRSQADEGLNVDVPICGASR